MVQLMQIPCYELTLLEILAKLVDRYSVCWSMIISQGGTYNVCWLWLLPCGELTQSTPTCWLSQFLLTTWTWATWPPGQWTQWHLGGCWDVQLWGWVVSSKVQIGDNTYNLHANIIININMQTPSTSSPSTFNIIIICHGETWLQEESQRSRWVGVLTNCVHHMTREKWLV